MLSRAAALNQKTIIVQPSVFLLQQTERDLRRIDPKARITAIHSGGGQDRVVQRIVEYLKSTDDQEKFLIAPRGVRTD